MDFFCSLFETLVWYRCKTSKIKGLDLIQFFCVFFSEDIEHGLFFFVNQFYGLCFLVVIITSSEILNLTLYVSGINWNRGVRKAGNQLLFPCPSSSFYPKARVVVLLEGNNNSIFKMKFVFFERICDIALVLT